VVAVGHTDRGSLREPARNPEADHRMPCRAGAEPRLVLHHCHLEVARCTVRRRDNYRCRACNKKPYRKSWYDFWRRKDWLTVHHGSYKEWKKQPGSEPTNVLFSLYRNCHDEVHARHRAGQFGSHEGSLLECTHWVIRRHQRKIANGRPRTIRERPFGRSMCPIRRP
jgi:hypothetical protein